MCEDVDDGISMDIMREESITSCGKASGLIKMGIAIDGLLHRLIN